MLREELFQKLKLQSRTVDRAEAGNEDLGPLASLPGTWQSLPGRGWNMIALPFADSPFNYRLLLNQYNETLSFHSLDGPVPNRGIRSNGSTVQADQLLVALDYEQMITQIAADDSPHSGEAGGPDLPIHHEPGLWLHMLNETTRDLDIARLATIPHGDSVLALGSSQIIEGPPTIPDVDSLPVGVDQDLNNPYLAPYRHFHDAPFQGLFDPVVPNELLRRALDGFDVTRTTILEVDTTVETGGIVNIPFIVRQANAADMKSTFWIEELAETDENGKPKLILQYSQVVMLDFFFPRRDGLPGQIRWPHVSINTLEKVSEYGTRLGE